MVDKKRHKRVNGEGSKPTKRKDGSWTCQIYLGKIPKIDEDGNTTMKPFRKSFYAKTQKAVIQKRDEFMRKWNSGDRLATNRSGKTTLGKYIEVWLGKKERELQSSTLVGYGNILKRSFTQLNTLKLEDITPEVVEDWRYRLKVETSEHRSNRARRLLRNILNTAVSEGLIQSNPVNKTKAYRIKKSESPYLKKHEIPIFFSAAKEVNIFWHNVFYIAFVCGMRPQEYLALQWEDIEFFSEPKPNGDHAEVHIRKAQKHLGNERYILGEPKSDSSERKLGLSKKAVEVLASARALVDARKAMAGDKWRISVDKKGNTTKFPYDLVFPSTTGTFAGRKNLHLWLRRTIEATKTEELPQGVTVITGHSFRHTLVGAMLDADVPVIEISRLVGHSTLSTTMDTYGHLLRAERSSMSFLDGLTDEE